MRHVFLNVAAVTLLAVISTAVQAAGFSSHYNVDFLLNQPHPLANQMGTRWQPILPAAAPIKQQQHPVRANNRPTPLRILEQARIDAQQQAATGADEQVGGIISEIRIGGLLHDEGPFSHRKEESFDFNTEFLFVSPNFLDVIWSPRPHIGVNINYSGDTSQIYLGLSYDWEFWSSWFAGFSVGGAVHNGRMDQGTGDTDRKELGCRVLFRESIEFGYRFGGRHSLSAMLDHISNAKLCDTNEGIENFGIRYGFRY